VQPATLSSAAATDAMLDLAQHAGATVISSAANWTALRPTASGAYHWAALDRLVDAARARGLTVRLQLQTIPVWARDQGAPTGYWVPPRSTAERARWAGFAYDVARHFTGRVQYLEVWNEPNETGFWPTGTDPDGYARLLAASYPAIRRGAPSAQIVSGGLSRNDVGFLEQVYRDLDRDFGPDARNNGYYFDVLGVHPYSGDRSPAADQTRWVHQTRFGTMDENFAGFTRLHQVMAAHADGAKSIYIGEYGFSTTAHNGFRGVPDATRARYLSEAFRVAARCSYVTAMSWYYLHATPWNDASWTLADAHGHTNLTYAALVSVARDM